MFACATIFHYERKASRPATSSLLSKMSLGNNPMSLLACGVQRRDNICATCAARRKQAQEHYDHLLLVNRDCNGVAKQKYYVPALAGGAPRVNEGPP